MNDSLFSARVDFAILNFTTGTEPSHLCRCLLKDLGSISFTTDRTSASCTLPPTGTMAEEPWVEQEEGSLSHKEGLSLGSMVYDSPGGARVQSIDQGH